MNEIRIKLPPELHQKWSNAARLRGLSVTSFVAVTVSEALLKTGELRYDSTISGLPKNSPIPTPVSVESDEPVDDVMSVWDD